MLLTRETPDWTSFNLSLSIAKPFDSSLNRLVISETWLSPKHIPLITAWLDSDPAHTILFISTFDPSVKNEILKEFAGYSQSRFNWINSTDICFCMLSVDKHFLNYSVGDVAVTEFKHDFLCYQRKITEPRAYLYEALQGKSGIVTIGDRVFDEINSDIPEHKGLTEIGGNEKVANDIWSLGNINIWNSSFLNIVSETEQALDTDYPFVSEKIFKPIVGLRPFICFGHPDTSKLLRSLGFETFDEDFGYYPTSSWKDNAKQIINIVDNLDVGLFDNLMPKLLHNKNHFKNAVKVEWEKVDALVKSYYI